MLFRSLSLGSAIDFIKSIGVKKVEEEVSNLTRHLVLELGKLSSVEMMPGVAFDLKTASTGIVSFVPLFEIERLECLLAQNRINLRIGQHCSKGVIDSVRVSLHAYNNIDDLDHLLNVLKNIEV